MSELHRTLSLLVICKYLKSKIIVAFVSFPAVIQPPAVITFQQTGPQSAQISWQAVDKVLVYLVTVSNFNNTIFSNRVFTTRLDLQNIAPCSTYQISVSSVNALLEPGEPREVNYSTNSKQARLDLLQTFKK